MQFNLEIPINSLSLGQIGYGVAYEIFSRGLNPNIFPIGAIDLGSFNKNTNFEYWLSNNVQKALLDFQDHPTISIWHLNGQHKRLGNRHFLWTVHECSEVTKQEVEICKGYEKVFVTSHYSKEVFEKGGVNNVEVCPNFFDNIHFKEIPVAKPEDCVNWGLFGKLEKRKATKNTLVAWANKYGNNKGHRLVAAIHNAFIPPEHQQQEIQALFSGRIPWNINFLPFQATNDLYNKTLNATDICLDLSCAEGWGLCLHNCLALGKHAVASNHTGHKEFCTPENCVLVEPSGTESIVDNIFFHPNQAFNSGFMFSMTQEAMHKGFEEAEQRFRENPYNEAGTKTKEFTPEKTVDILLSSL